MKISLAPHSSTEIAIPFELPQECNLGSYLSLYMYNTNGEKEGMVQLELPVRVKRHVLKALPLELKDTGEYIIAEGENFYYCFSKLYGNFTSIVKNGTEQLANRVKITVHRAPTDNDRRVKAKWNFYEDNVFAENFNRLCSKVYNCDVSENVITVNGSLAGISRTPFFRYKATYEFFKNGEVHITVDGNIKEEMKEFFLPRFGFEFTLAEKNCGFNYYGYGKEESYCDMHYHAEMGMYHSTAADEYFPYPMPQEHGNHFNTKWLKIDNGLEFLANDIFEFNVSEYTSLDLEKAEHINELKKNGYTNLRIDYKVSGIGSASCGPELMKEYQLDEKEICFSFIMR